MVKYHDIFVLCRAEGNVAPPFLSPGIWIRILSIPCRARDVGFIYVMII